MSKTHQHSDQELSHGELLRAIDNLLGERPIVFYPSLARALKSVSAAVLLGQLYYWTKRKRDPGEWIWKTREEIASETALSRREQETARKTLVAAGVLEERLAGVPARMHFHIKMPAFLRLLADGDDRDGGESTTAEGEATKQPVQLGGNVPTGWTEPHQPVGRKRTNWKGASVPTNSETTSESTTENTHHQGAAVPAQAAPAPRQGSDDDDLASLLTERGVSTRAASLLVRKHPSELIRTQVSYFDFRAQSHSSQLGKNPAGFLRRSIEENYPAPQGYVDPEQQAERKRRAEEQARAEAEAAAREHQERLHDLAMEYLEPAADRARRSVQRREEVYRRTGKVLYINDAEREVEIATLTTTFQGHADEFFANHPEFDHLRAEAQGENLPPSTQPTKPKKGRKPKLSAPEAPTTPENGRVVERDLSPGKPALRASQTPQNPFLAHRQGELSARGSPG